MDFPIANKRTVAALAVIALSLLSAACANFPTREPPFWIFPDMKKQDKVKYESASPFFSDRRGSRRPVAYTVAQETYSPDVPYSTGIETDGTYVARNPVPMDRALLERGEAKFNVYCSPCHDRTGSGRGVVPAKSNGSRATCTTSGSSASWMASCSMLLRTDAGVCPATGFRLPKRIAGPLLPTYACCSAHGSASWLMFPPRFRRG